MKKNLLTVLFQRNYLKPRTAKFVQNLTTLIYSRWRMHLNLNENGAKSRTCASRDVAPLT